MPVIDQAPLQPTPLTEHVQVISIEPDTAESTVISTLVTVDPENPIFAGHYPGLPIFPGVCLIECVHRTVLAAPRPRGVAPIMEAVLKARFLTPVFPGDEISTRARITKDAQQWTATAVLHGKHGVVATIDLRYRLPGGGS